MMIESPDVHQHQAADEGLATPLALAVAAYTIDSVTRFAIEATAIIAIVTALLLAATIAHS